MLFHIVRKPCVKIECCPAHLPILFAIACSRALWFSPGKIVTSGDLVVPTSSIDFLNDRLYMWNEVDFGQPSVLLPRLISPLHLTLGLLNIFNVSNEWGQIFYAVLMYWLGSYFIYRLTKLLSPKNKTDSAPLFASLFYLFNPLLINDGIQTSIMFLPFYVTLPVILYFYIQALNKRSWGHVFMTAVVASLLASGIPSFRDLIIGMLMLGAYATYYILTTRDIKNCLTISGLVFAFTFMLNMFWLFPFLISPRKFLTKFELLSLSASKFQTHRYTTLLNVIRGFGKWSFFSSIQGTPYLAYSHYYNENILVIVATFMLPLLIFSAVLFYRRREILFMCSVALLFIFLSKGINPPFGELYSLVVTGIPIFKAVRESSFFLQGLMIPYSYLLGHSCQAILFSSSKVFPIKLVRSGFSRHRLVNRTVLVSFLLFPLLGTSWPLVTGDVITLWSDPNWRGVTFPESYRAISGILKMNEPTRVIVLPQSTTYVTYEWGYSGGRNILQYILPVPLVMANPGDEYFPSGSIEFVQSLYDLANTGEYDLFANILRVAGIEFVLVEKGLISELGEVARKYVNDLEDLPYFTKVREFEDVALFRVENSHPVVYAPSKVVTYHETKLVLSNQYMIKKNLSDGWIGTPQVEAEYNGSVTRLEFVSDGQYTVCSKVIVLPSKGLDRGSYIVLPFRTSPGASVTLAIGRQTESDEYLYAINPTPEYVRNAYASNSFYTVIFRLHEDIPDATSIKLFATNFLNKQYVGNLSFTFGSLSVVGGIGSLVDALSRTDSDQSQTFALINLDKDCEIATEVESIVGNKIPEIKFLKVDPTRYLVNVNSTDPFVLILSQTFDDEWKAKIGTETINKHFVINGFANGWIIEHKGIFQTSLEYSPQREVEFGRFLSALTMIFSSIVFSRNKIKHAVTHALRVVNKNERSK